MMESLSTSDRNYQTDHENRKSEVTSPSKPAKKSNRQRRKSASKPRRIHQNRPRSDEINNSEKRKSLDTVLQRVLKRQETPQPATMIDMHETIGIGHHHSKPVGGVTVSPGSVESAASLYSERENGNLSDSTASRSPEPFVKILPRSNSETASDQEMQDAFEPANIKRSQSSEEMHIGISPPGQEKSPVRHSLSADADDNAVQVARYAPASYPNLTHLPFQQNPVSSYPPIPPTYSTMASNQSSAMAAIAAGMALPTMIPTSAMPSLIQMSDKENQFALENYRRSESKNEKPKPTFSGARGIIGSSTAPCRVNGSPPPEERSQYKRPPHTYPALIASAILDSPGHLITLRGIYDYIMNHFPYYKYCHDKSAWQNSIRHNLSLNQCFIKVPRYENAAKSNYWTMTREGFDEFGNENSFKRRRRRGAALAPISAYKAKKYQGSEGGSKRKSAQSGSPRRNSPPANGAGISPADQPQRIGMHPLNWPYPDLASFHEDAARMATSAGRKRSQSPQADESGVKHPRMVVLKQGDGPNLGGIKSDDPHRPNSLSSVEEMQGTLNSFSKSLIDTSGMLAKSARPSALMQTSTQPWLAAAQKNLMASSGMFMPSLVNQGLMTSQDENNVSGTTDEVPVMMENVKIGTEVKFDASEIPIRHFRCHFCHYTYVSTTSSLLEQHARMLHQLEITNAKAKAVAAAAVAKTQIDRSATDSAKESSERLMSLQNMVSNLSPRSMMAAAQSNAHNLLAAAQASGAGNTAFPYSVNFASGLLDESVMRSFAEQVSSQHDGNREHEEAVPSMEAYNAYQRQQALNTALQQAAAVPTAAGLPQEQIRMFYQQLAMNNSLLANGANAANFQRPVLSQETEQSSQLKQLWQYQQKLRELTQLKNFESQRTSSPEHRPSPPQQGDARNSACTSPAQNSGSESDTKKSLHAWKQCNQCDFTAKGSHGLELHCRKAHEQSDAATSSDAYVTNASIGSGGESANLASLRKDDKSQCPPSFSKQCGSPTAAMTSPSYPTPPLSNSPSYAKRAFTPLDLSGAKEEEERAKSSSSAASKSHDDVTERRTCRHCDITFGDQMMYALHMSCHDKNRPYQCTICGQDCNEKYYFNVHLLRGLHQTNNNHVVESSQAAPRLSDVRRQSSDSLASAGNRSRLNSENSDAASA